MNLPSASGLQRAEACSGSEALPHVERLRPAAEHGTDVHAFLERVPKVGAKSALDELEDADLRSLCGEIDLSRLPLDSGAYAQEVAFAYDFESGKARELGRALKRHYGMLGKTEIPGTTDVGALEQDDGVYIGDYKTGFRYELTAPPLEKHRQLRFLAKAASAAWGRSAATIEIIRLNDEGKAWKKSLGLGPFDLDREGEDLRRIGLAVIHEREAVAAGKSPTLVAGPHCGYCPAFSNCPEIRGQVRAVLADEGDPQALAASLTDETARLLAERIPLVEEAARRAKEVLKFYAAERPVALANGTVYGPVEATRREIDGVKARSVLSKYLGDATAAEKLPVKVSQDAIKDLITPFVKASGDKVAPVLRALMEEIENVGGITTRKTIEVRQHKPKEARR